MHKSRTEMKMDFYFKTNLETNVLNTENQGGQAYNAITLFHDYQKQKQTQNKNFGQF